MQTLLDTRETVVVAQVPGLTGGALGLFELSKDGGATWFSPPLYLLPGQPFLVRVYCVIGVTLPGTVRFSWRVWVIQPDGVAVEQTPPPTQDLAVSPVDSTYQATTTLVIDFPNGFPSAGDWGLRVELYGQIL